MTNQSAATVVAQSKQYKIAGQNTNVKERSFKEFFKTVYGHGISETLLELF